MGSLNELAGFSKALECENWLIPDRQQPGKQDELSVLRLDKLSHPACPQLSGNKLFKLLPNLAKFISEDFKSVTSFGGPWSNHIWSLSAALASLECPLDIIVRGQRSVDFTPTLRDAQASGARLHFVPRSYYDRYAYQSARVTLADTKFTQCFGLAQSYLIPSGGANRFAVFGALVLGAYLSECYPSCQVYCAAGTGSFSLGLALGAMLGSSGKASINVVGVCMGGDRLAVESRNAQLLIEVLEDLQDSSELSNNLGIEDAQLSVLSRRARSFSAEFSALGLPLVYRDAGHQFGQLSSGSKCFLRSLSELNRELIDPVYLGPLLSYVSEYAGLGQHDKALSMVIHGGGQQGARSQGEQA